MDPLLYTKELVAFESTSNLSNIAVSDCVEKTLKSLGFETERVEYDDPRGVRKANILGKKGTGSGGLGYFAHTDVVPADPWFSEEHGPFVPTVKGNKLYGRGSCDMKGSIACMLAAAGRYQPAQLKQPIYVTCTADEEVGYGGAAEVAKRSQLFQEMVKGKTRGIIGEPTMLEVVYAHKGTYGFKGISRGKAAHSSTREGLNANLAMIPFLVEMKKLYEETETDPRWQNNEFNPPVVSWNIGINDHTKAINITAPQSICTVYYRPMPGQKPDELIERARAAAKSAGIDFEVQWCAGPLYTDPKSPFVREMLDVAGKNEARTAAYGTDGTMFTALENLVVFGPGSVAQAHTHDEWIDLAQLELGTEMFSRAIQKFCT
ncbi:MAG: M20 family metallopeptidase [Planctomycetaceae bacterium]